MDIYHVSLPRFFCWKGGANDLFMFGGGSIHLCGTHSYLLPPTHPICNEHTDKMPTDKLKDHSENRLGVEAFEGGQRPDFTIHSRGGGGRF